MGANLSYLELTQKGKLPLLRVPEKERRDGSVQIDAATRRNLELTRSLSGGREGSLLRVIDKTVTSAGARLLERRLSSPSTDLVAICARHDAVEAMVNDPNLRGRIRDALRGVPDVDRSMSRLGLDRAGPRDLAAIRDGLAQSAIISANISEAALPELLSIAGQDLIGFDDLGDLLFASLVADPPLMARDGGFIAAGYDAELDEARKLRDEGRGVVAALQTKYSDLADISALKIKHNNVLGYFIETPATHAKKMLAAPLSETFIHRQTTANAVRFTTVELSGLETRILNAGNRALEIEKRLYSVLSNAILAQSARILSLARALAEIDLCTMLAELSEQLAWVRPKMDMSRAFVVSGGRHPVVEDALSRQTGTQFVANDCDLSAKDGASLWLLTGPNMAGKSTFLRQNCLIALLAQMGSFVPAKSAHIGVVSQVFSRVGAADDLARGRSTFMVEMVETAAILNQADDRALVILDEIGRGTATYDGLSIAWATLEHLHAVNKCRGLFATHYHELTHLAEQLDGVENATVAVKEWEGDVIFLHEVVRGAADRSYGVQVGKLAGLPLPVVARAKEVLQKLESGDRQGGSVSRDLFDDLPLFSATPAQAQPLSKTPEVSELEAQLNQINPDELTPKQALELLYELKSLTISGSS